MLQQVVIQPAQGSSSQQSLLDAQLLAFQQSLLGHNIDSSDLLKPPSNPIQISIQPKLSSVPAIANLSQLPPTLPPSLPQALNMQKIIFKQNSPISSLLSSKLSPVSSDAPSPVPRTADELGALLRQDQSPVIPSVSPLPPLVVLPSYVAAIDSAVSLLPLPDDKLIGSFGSEVEDPSSDASSVQPGQGVQLVRDLSAPILVDSSSSSAYKVQVQNLQNQPIGYLPTRIGNWLSLLIPSQKLRLRARRPNQFTPNVLLLIDLFVSKISSDEWQAYSITEKAAWRELSLRVGRPLGDIVPARSLQSELEPLLSSASQSLVKAGSNIKSSNSGTRSVGSSGSGGVKRSADTDVPLESSNPSKRTKLNLGLGASSPQLVVKFNASNSRLPSPLLAQSSPVAAAVSKSKAVGVSASYLQSQGSALSSGFAEATNSLSDQTERQFIDDLFAGLQHDCTAPRRSLSSPDTILILSSCCRLETVAGATVWLFRLWGRSGE